MDDIPVDLVRRLGEAARAGVYSEPTAEELDAQARLAIELADYVGGRPDAVEALGTPSATRLTSGC